MMSGCGVGEITIDNLLKLVLIYIQQYFLNYSINTLSFVINKLLGLVFYINKQSSAVKWSENIKKNSTNILKILFDGPRHFSDPKLPDT